MFVFRLRTPPYLVKTGREGRTYNRQCPRHSPPFPLIPIPLIIKTANNPSASPKSLHSFPNLFPLLRSPVIRYTKVDYGDFWREEEGGFDGGGQGLEGGELAGAREKVLEGLCERGRGGVEDGLVGTGRGSSVSPWRVMGVRGKTGRVGGG